MPHLRYFPARSTEYACLGGRREDQDPGHQGHGVGRALLEHAIAFFRRSGMQVAKIETLEQNPVGQNLYPGLGFVEVARQIHYAMRLAAPGKAL